MAFKEVLGQKNLIKNLKKVIVNNKASHAYLIEGLKGVGKKEFAFSLGKAVLCQNIDEKNTRICACSSCKKFKDNNHPEFHSIEEDGSIKIEHIRQIQKSVHIKPYEGNKKVYVIYNGERMTQQAQNALLKTLEEPPGHSVIIITTQNLKSLLPTIISRCQLLRLKPQGVELVKDYLVNRFNVSDEEAKVVATFSNGLVDTAIKLYNNDDFKLRRLRVIDITDKFLNSKTIEILKEMEFFNNEKTNIEEIIDLFIFWYRDVLIYKQTRNESLIINSDQIGKIYSQAEKIRGFSNIKEVILILEEKKQQIRGNVNYSLAIEVMLLNIQDLFSS